MDKKELIKRYKKFLRKYHLTPKEVLVTSGSALCVHGLRDRTNDIDTSVTKEVFDYFKSFCPSHYFGDTLVLEVREFEIDLHEVSDEVIAKGVMVDGVWCQTLEDILAFKQKLNREKDQEDIKNIKKRLGMK